MDPIPPVNPHIYSPQPEPIAPRGRSGFLANLLAWLVIAACVVVAIINDSGEEEAPECAAVPQAAVEVPPQVLVLAKIFNGVAWMQSQAGQPAGQRGLHGGGPMGDPAEQLTETQVSPGGELGVAAVLARVGEPGRGLAMVERLELNIMHGEVTADPAFMQLLEDVRVALKRVDDPAPDALSAEQADLIRTQLGLPGRTLVAMATGDTATLDELGRQGIRALVFIGVLMCPMVLVGLAGVGFLIWFLCAVLAKKAKGPGPAAGVRAHLYAEMFAAWMVLHTLLSMALHALLKRAHEADGTWEPSANLQVGSHIAIFALAVLGAIAYVRLRGMSMREWSAGVGLHRPRLSDLWWGFVTYAMALPLVLVGVAVSFVLSLFVSAPPGGPSHPIQQWVQSAGPLGILLIYVLACVCAPVVEEIVFRGAMYRNLRDLFGRAGPLVAALGAMAVSSLIFAAIHPQGVLLVPVLGALAVAFCLAREWRGSINPSIWAHAINNGLMITLNILLLR